MNRQSHTIIGFIAYAVLVLVLYQIRPIGMDVILMGAIASAVGSVLPDLIEPSGDWRHRGFAHSKRILWLTLLALLSVSPVAIFFPHLLMLAGVLIGYGAHLLADATTPAGIND